MSIVLQALDWRTYDDRVARPEKMSAHEWAKLPHDEFIIDVFGVTEDKRTVSARIHGFRPYFFVELPRRLSDVEFDNLLDTLAVHLQQRGGYCFKHKEEFMTERCKQVARLRFGGYQWDRKRAFAKLVFSTDRGRKKCARLLQKGVPVADRQLRARGFQAYHSFPLYESNVEPLLRFFHKRRINPSGWVQIPEGAHYASCPCIKETAIDVQCDDWTRLLPSERTSIGPIVLCSFDIEADSSHGDFPLAIKTYTKLANDIVDLFIEKHIEPHARLLSRTTVRRWLRAAFGIGGEVPGISRVHTKRGAVPPAELFTTPCERARYETAAMREQCVDVLVTRADLQQGADDDAPGGGSASKNFLVVSAAAQAAQSGAARSAGVDEEHAREMLTPEDWLHQLLLRARKKYAVLGKMPWRAYRRLLFRAVALFLAQVLSAFPVEGDSVIQIGSVFWRFGEERPFLKSLIALGTCDPIEGCEVQSCTSERDVLVKWATLIRELSPDVLTGYNIFGFDYKFMWERAEELDCTEDFGALSKVIDWRTRTRHYAHRGCKNGMDCLQSRIPGCKLIEKELTSAGLGENFLYYMDTPGITQVDLIKIVMRDHKLSSYKLDDVASKFIFGKVKRVEPADAVAVPGAGTNLWTDNRYGLAEGDYVRIMRVSDIGEDAVEDGRKFHVLKIVEDAGAGEVCLVLDGAECVRLQEGKHQWGLAKDDVSPKDIFRLQKGSSADRAIVGKYCVQDCVLVLHLIMKLQIITNNIGMSTVCHVPLQYIFTRGQGIKTFSLVANECRKLGYVIPVLERPYDDNEGEDEDEEEEREGYEGAVVLPPRPGIYLDDPVAVLDYSSLYPSSMISENLCHTTQIEDPEYLGDAGAARLRAAGLTFKDITYDNYVYTRKGKTVTKRINEQQPTMCCRFIQPRKDDDGVIDESSRGIIPRILKVVLAQRKATRKRIKTEKDPFVRDVLDGQQLALKVSANSVYGSIGARVNPLYRKDVAACTTATGRRLLTWAKTFVTENYPGSECVYGDTDSVFIAFHPRGEDGEKLKGAAALERCIALGQEAGERSKALLEAPHDLEYEKTFFPFILFSKKRYVGHKFEFDPTSSKLTSMGIVLKRRDNARILKHVYKDVIHCILDNQQADPVRTSIDLLQHNLQKLVNGEFPLEYLIISKSLRSHYDNPEQIVHKALADRMAERDPGNKPEANDRIPYVYFDVGSRKVELQGDRVEHPEYMREKGLQPDYMFYITNQIAKPVSQIYALIVEQLDGYKYLPGHFERIAGKLREEGRDEVKVRKKIEELRAKEVMRLLFEPLLQRERNRREGNQDLRQWFG